MDELRPRIVSVIDALDVNLDAADAAEWASLTAAQFQECSDRLASWSTQVPVEVGRRGERGSARAARSGLARSDEVSSELDDLGFRQPGALEPVAPVRHQLLRCLLLAGHEVAAVAAEAGLPPLALQLPDAMAAQAEREAAARAALVDAAHGLVLRGPVVRHGSLSVTTGAAWAGERACRRRRVPGGPAPGAVTEPPSYASRDELRVLPGSGVCCERPRPGCAASGRAALARSRSRSPVAPRWRGG